MKKRIFAVLVAAIMVLGLAACGSAPAGDTPATDPPATDTPADPNAPTTETAGTGSLVINLWSFTDEVPNMVARYIELNPAFGERYTINTTIIATTEGAYQPALDQALVSGGSDAPDIFAAEAAFVLKYTQGDMAQFAMPYADLGIDVQGLLAQADIAQYTIDIGTNPDGQLVGLGFQATGGAFIYRRSIAQEVFGTDDPTEIQNIVGPGWDTFMTAAQKLNDAGYAALSGPGDLWQVVRNTNTTPWVVDDGGTLTLYIDPAREAFLDMHKTLIENNLTNQANAWQDAWFADMSGTGEREVFAFMGPAWLINYVMAGNAGETYGDWAVTVAPEGFFWGGTWVIANAQGNPEVRDGVAELIEWITLNSTDDGLQFHWANGTLFADNPTKDSVASSAVMSRSDGTVDFLGGQNMFDIFVPAGSYARGDSLSQYDETISQFFMDASTQYANGEMSREDALRFFKQQVADNLAVTVNFN